MKLNQLLAARHADAGRHGFKTEKASVSSGYYDSSSAGEYGKRKIATIALVGTKIKIVIDSLVSLPDENVIESQTVLFDFSTGNRTNWEEVNGQESLFKL